ncbi:MAG: hypothetical protein E7603_07480 [Ruminococcaceae bacterium]|nr:hypothetical protein [Oscillospiraceae bacterium]
MYLIIALLFAELSPLEYQTVNGTYHSYREDRVGMHTTLRYLTVENSDTGQTEYQIQPIAFQAFDKKYFFQEVAVGDPIELTLQEGEIVSIRTNEKSYMNKADSLEKQQNNTVMGYCVGGGFIVISLFAFSSLIMVRRSRPSKKRRH